MNSESAQEEEEQQLQSKGDELEAALSLGGVYVYTFPQYWRSPTVSGTRRTLLKIGMSTRIGEQARGTVMPGEPLILRVYQSASSEPRDLERTFHRLLNAADHTRENNNAGGREWFETSVEFLDTIPTVLGL